MTFLTRLSLSNRLLVGLIAGLIAVFGVVSATELNQELIPSAQTPGTTVLVSVPGSSPEVLETTVTEPLESALQSVPDIETIVSTTSSGSVRVSVTWPFEADSDEQAAEVQAALDRVSSSLPEGAVVNVVAASIDDYPVIQMAVSTTGDRQRLVDQLEQNAVPTLQALPGVQDVQLSGQDETRVAITLRPEDVDELDIDTSTLPQLLQANGVVVPAGQSATEGLSLPVEVGSTLDSVEEIANIAIPTPDGPVMLSEIADVSEEAVPETTLARVNGSPALTLGVTKSRGENVVEVSHAVTAATEEIQAELGDDVDFVTIFDQAPYIEQSIEDLTIEGGLGLLFAVLVILAFLGSFRPTLIAAISIPMSLLVTLIVLLVGGFTLNIFTLGALTIAIGRVVDDSIVVIENIKRRHREGELTVDEIAASVKQVAGAITASTITTVAVFLPIAFVGGIAGQLFRPFAVTVTVALLASLIVSLTIVPTLAYWLMRRPEKPPTAEKAARREKAQAAWEEGERQRAAARHSAALARTERANARRAATGRPVLPAPTAPVVATGATRIEEAETPYDRLQRPFVRVLGAALRNRGRTIAFAVAVLLGTLVLSAGLKVDFLGDVGQDALTISQTMPLGSSLETNDAAAKKLEAVIDRTDGIESYVTTVGGGGSFAAFSRSAAPPSSISVTLEEEADPGVVEQSLEDGFEKLTDIGEVTVATLAAGELSGDIELLVAGEDLDALAIAATALEREIGELESVADASTDLAAEQPVLRIDVDPVQAAEYGYTPASVGDAVSKALESVTIGVITLEGAERDIVVSPSVQDATPEQIEALELPVTQLQQARAQSDAADEYQEEQEAEADRAQADAEADLARALRDLRSARADAREQAAELRAQYEALAATPVPPGPPYQSEAAAARAANLTALQQAAAQAQGAVSSIDAQIDQIQAQQESAAEQRENAQEAADRQEEIQNAEADPIQVSDIATVSQVTTPATISREDGNRQVTVSATPETGRLADATLGVNQIMADADLPEGVSVSLGGVSTQQEESFAQLGLAMLIAIALVFLVMVATFHSVIQPLILLVSIPFAATGALLLMLVTGTPLGLPALIGLLMLIGIVVTNAIVLIDLINKFRTQTSISDAVTNGARLRLRPILMTAAATVFALLPMAFGLTGGGVFISRPLAIVVIGGLISSTLFTLVLVPVLYTFVEERNERASARRARRRPLAPAPADGLAPA